MLTSLLVILLLTPFTVQQIAASSRQVSRLNYGILFSPVRRVQLVSDVWSHIFDIHLPDITPGNLHLTLPHCDNATSNAAQERAERICVNNRALFLELHKQHVEMVTEILATLQHVYHLLPAEKNISRPTMAKRSLLPIGRYILSGLFDTTSEADLSPVKKHMRSIAQCVTHLDRGLQDQSDRLASFIEMSAVRMDSFRNLTTMQETAITELYDELGVMFNTQTQEVQRLVMTLRRIQPYVTHFYGTLINYDMA